MKDKKFVLLGLAVAAVAIGVFFKNEIKSVIVDILKSLDRTLENEGVWQPESAKGQKDDIGNYYPREKGKPNRKYYGTNYGITAYFLKVHFDTLQIPLIDTNTIKNLTRDQIAECYKLVLGTRMR